MLIPTPDKRLTNSLNNKKLAYHLNQFNQFNQFNQQRLNLKILKLK